MRALIIGGGLVGSTLAAKLSRDGHEVVVVEQAREQLRALAEQLDVHTLEGNGTTVSVLRKAGIDECDVLFACTSSDEANMVAALIGSTIFGVPRVVARLRESEHQESFQMIADKLAGTQVAVNPDMAAVEKVVSLLPVPGALDLAPFLDGRLLLAGFPIRPGSGFAGLLLSHLRLLFPAHPVLVVAIGRGERWFVPHGDDEILTGDTIYLAIVPEEIDNVLNLLGVPRPAERRVLVGGATRIGLTLAARLDAAGTPVTLFDDRVEEARRAAAMLRNALVIKGSPTNQLLLEEEGADTAAAFVACSDDHQENVLACLLARRLGTAHTFALVDNPGFASLTSELGIDAIISPRLLTVGLALQFVRRGRVRAAAALLEDYIEAVEVDVPPESKLTFGPLAEIGLPRGILVAALLRDGRLIVPKGDDRIHPGDRAVLVTATENARQIDALMGG